MEQVGVNTVPLKDIEELSGVCNHGEGASGSGENLGFYFLFFFKKRL